jgi:hypothetical protein
MAGEAVPPATRATRLAANVATAAVVLYGALYLLTTQVGAIRDSLPWTADPYDAVVSISILLLPIVVGVTWIRSLRYRESGGIPVQTRRRIERGVGLAVVLVLAGIGGDLWAVAVEGSPTAPPAILALVGLTGVTGMVAGVLLVQARRLRSSAAAEVDRADPEPDVLDDAIRLVVDGGSAVRPLAPPLGQALLRAASRLDGFLERSRLSPRRAVARFTIAVSIALGVGAVAWHAVVEGAWASLPAALLFGVITGAVALVGLGPIGAWLRILRPA